MLLYLPLLGQGTAADPYRAPLPTYNLLELDVPAGLCLVDVRSIDLTRDIATTPPSAIVVAAAAVPGIRPRPALLPAWHQLLDRRYAEHAGRYRPQAP